MRIDISGHQMEITSALRDYAQDKMGRLAKHFETHLDTRMILSVDKLDRLVIKQKEKIKDHHRGSSAARSDSFG